jgi:hypothetical protein
MNKQERIYRKTIPFTIASKKKPQITGNKLNRDVKDLYKANDKPLKKEIEEDHRRWKDLIC